MHHVFYLLLCDFGVRVLLTPIVKETPKWYFSQRICELGLVHAHFMKRDINVSPNRPIYRHFLKHHPSLRIYTLAYRYFVLLALENKRNHKPILCTIPRHYLQQHTWLFHGNWEREDVVVGPLNDCVDELKMLQMKATHKTPEELAGYRAHAYVLKTKGFQLGSSKPVFYSGTLGGNDGAALGG